MGTSQVIDLVKRERDLALSNREWRHRLKGFGYGIRETENGAVIEMLRDRSTICSVPADLLH
ncbi:MAG: hypothetical protein AAGG57_05965 [Pseudomonadota bacterium]